MAACMMHTVCIFSQSTVKAQVADRYLLFSTTDAGIRHEGIRWGLDTAWDNETNVRRGIAFMGKENVEVMRVSFQPTYALVNDEELTSQQRRAVNNRITHVRLAGTPDLLINSDHPSVDSYYTSGGQANAAHWAKLIMVTTRMFQDAGFKVVTISPFNEPDYTATGQGTLANMREICRVLKTNYADELGDIRISGGNTLNDDYASQYYNTLKPYVDEGNTHQLAGTMANYANFFSEVRADGNHASADEMHNVGDALVALEYGLQTGVWWGYDSRARGQMCRATKGDRLAYAENRDAWTAAAVYRNLQDDVIECFVGGSERQAKSSSFMFVCTDREVYYDCYGPSHEFYIDYPGGSGYQSGQTNAERVIDLSWGKDVQPDTINGTYKLMNRSSRRVLSLEVSNESSVTGGTNVCIKTTTSARYNHWKVTPVSNRVGGDFSFYSIRSVVNDYAINVWNWSLSSGGDVRLYNGGGGDNEQWYLKYAGNGYYYIVSRYSNLYLTAASTSNGANVTQATLATTETRRALQQWRIIPTDAACETVAPDVPADLSAKANVASIRLDWTANTEDDLDGYMILRAEDGTDNWNTIARKVKTNTYLDNHVRPGVAYKYSVKAIDRTNNQSALSDSVKAQTATIPGLVGWWGFDNDLTDQTPNGMNASMSATPHFSSLNALTKVGSGSLSMSDGTSFLQLPYRVASSPQLTITMWLRWSGSTAGANQHLFDFGTSTDNCMYLTPSNGQVMRLSFNAGGQEQHLDAPRISTTSWRHVAVTIGDEYIRIYQNGTIVAETRDITLRPTDITTIMNYIGRSQNPIHPLLKAYIDDLRIYNYELTPAAVASIASMIAEDVNLDGTVDTQDVLAIYEAMQATDANGIDPAADVNHDGVVDTQDVLCVYEKIQSN